MVALLIQSVLLGEIDMLESRFRDLLTFPVLTLLCAFITKILRRAREKLGKNLYWHY